MSRMLAFRGLAAAVLAAALFIGVRAFLVADELRPAPPVITTEMLDAMKTLPGGLTFLPEVPVPEGNPQRAAKIELGKRLFFDVRLSQDRSSSCATCHSPEKAFADGLARARGFQGVTLSRNSPTVLNAAYNTAQFWDGRAATLDEQCKGPLLSAAEMNMIDERHLIERLNNVPGYVEDFQEVFGAAPTLDNVSKAIAAFERTLVNSDSRFDRYVRGDKKALDAHEKHGLILFFSKASCSECHKGPNFTDNQFYSLGTTNNDPGRYAITQHEADRNAFKTPTLRNVALTGPYMHDGSSATLEDVIEIYNRGGDSGPNKSKLVYPLNLTNDEKADLVAFLKALTGTVPKVEVPAVYPDAGPQSAALSVHERQAR